MNSFIAFGLAFLLCAPVFAQDDPDPVDPYQQGIAAFQAKDYEGAIRFFERAFELKPDKKTLFAWAQAERLTGDCKSATILYNRLLRMAPSAKQTQVVSQALAECERELSPAELKEVRAELAKLDLKPTPKDDKDKKERTTLSDKQRNKPIVVETRVVKSGSARTPSYFLMAAGLVSVGVGATFLALARSANQSEASTFQQRLDNVDLAESRQTISTITFIGGGALLATGLVWFFAAGGETTEEVPVASWITPDSAGVTFSGRF